VFAELRAVCDPQVRLWVNAATLKNRDLWQPGWAPLEDGIPCGRQDPLLDNPLPADDFPPPAGIPGSL